MYTQQQLTTALGKVLLFCGVETNAWGPANFGNVAAFCRAHGIDSILVKVADGGNLWYGGWNTIDAIRNTIVASGVGFVPYAYCYGNKYNALASEIAIAKEALSRYGYYCMDMEAEYDGELGWAHTLASSFASHSGILLCSTWADPALQNWQGVLSILASTFDAFMPQEYTNYLDSTEYQLAQAGIRNMIPTIYLGADMPGNTAYAVAADIHARGHTSISLWYDQFAINNPALVDNVVNIYRVAPPTPLPKDYTHMDKQFADVWSLNTLGLAADTGIARDLKSAFHDMKVSACYPTSKELQTVDWDGNVIIYQTFSNGVHGEHKDSHTVFYAADNSHLWG